MKQLIVNADDLGADEDRNRGIFEAIQAGVVTSVSILPNGPALEDALAKIRHLVCNNVSVGIHFNLSEGRPVSQNLKLLAGPDGHFRGKAASQQLFVRPGNAQLDDEIRREFNAQISVFRDAGIPLAHLDGHQHIHVLPAVIRPVLAGAKEQGISWIRVPEEPPNEFQPGSQEGNYDDEARFFNGYAQKARPVVEEAGFFTTHFRGLYFKGSLPAPFWYEFLQTIPEGVSELMVHPGRALVNAPAGPFSRFSTFDRERELEELTDGRLHIALMNTGVKLIPFPEAPFS